MKQLNKFLFRSKETYILMFFLYCIAVPIVGWYLVGDNFQYPGDRFEKKYSYDIADTLQYGPLHTIFTALYCIAGVFGIIVMAYNWGNFDDIRSKIYNNNDDQEDAPELKFNFKSWFSWALCLTTLFFTFKFFKYVFVGSIELNNKSIVYVHDFEKATQRLDGFYDKMWKTFKTKSKIQIESKETFVEVCKIIMTNRADGKNLAWKWLQENQNIDFNEYNKFYTDLSDYITEQREIYYKLETERQDIANSHNIMLDTFPNSFFNRGLQLKQIKYEYAFTSDSTANVFRTKRENLK